MKGVIYLYIIGVYDISENRVNKVKKVFDKYLDRCQNSVYQGELSHAEYAKLKKELKKKISQDMDSVIFFTFASKKYRNKEVLGIEKNEETNIL